ncbi:MAG: LON peptidase substrate-binding domain-containing protein [Acidimicrobiales bacterium]|nr:LON peptidase substrate-binding domain-containing protein [Acidimicrobiales bacterium]
MYELPMFPLEQTVLPTAVVPLHLFEPRYRQFARDVTARDEPDFGTAPIERGREVGGDDVRADVGVVARIIQHEEFDDGRWGLVASATRRIRVVEWLPDDPYPRALVEDWPDADADAYRDAIDVADRAGLEAGVERIRAAAGRLQPGRAIPEIVLAEDHAQAIWQAAVVAQLGPLDGSDLLAVPGVAARLERAVALIGERAEMLEALADERG